MIRLLAIAVISLASLLFWLWAVSGITGENNIAGWLALVLGFFGTPFALLRVWKGPNASSKCPGGKGLYPECMFLVKVSSEEISVQRPDGTLEVLSLPELQEVAIVTNDSGPVGADVWWVLSRKSSGSACSFPGGATGEQEVLKFVQKLPGFNNERFIQAMGSTSNARFVCWSGGA